MTRIIIVGSKGRMGLALKSCAARQSDTLKVVGEIDMGDSLDSVIDAADAVIDFSFQENTLSVAQLCASRQKPLIIGTTGQSPEHSIAIRKCAETIPLVWATNFSTGVNVLFWLTQKAAHLLGDSFDKEVIELHHRHKKDAPSGTATTLAEILAEAIKVPLDESARHGRQGIVGARTDREIGIHSLRGGDVVGDHTVVFAGDGERLELTHKAASRDCFANGALRASVWSTEQAPGLYDMRDVLGLK